MWILGKATCGRWALSLAALAVSCIAFADQQQKVELKAGDRAPTIEAIDDQGQPWKSSDYLGKYLVIYFYPGDFTPGCTAQANSFRTDMAKLTAKDIVVVGVSEDSVTTHELFKKSQKLNFGLLADEDGGLAQKFGVPVTKGAEVKAKDAEGKPVTLVRKGTAARWTFVIGKDGNIVSKSTNVNAAQDSRRILELIEKLEKQ